MDSRDIIRKMYEQGPNKAVNTKDNAHLRDGNNYQEDAMAECYDQKKTLLKHKEMLEKLAKGELEPQQAFQAVSSRMIASMINLAETSQSEKVQFAAIKDLLDRAGLAPVTKAAILGANIDPNHSKEELLSLIEGLAKKTKAVDLGE